MRDLIIGVDGGGTRTRAWLANLRGETLGSGEAGSSNPQTQGFEKAQEQILLAIQRGFANAGIPKQLSLAACLGVGGVDRGPEREYFVEWAHANVSRRVAVHNDGQIAIAAGTPENWGIALIAGTGAIAWGLARDGRIARASGWGYLLGDEGSSFDLGRKALRSVTRAADGRGEKTKLVDVILNFWHLEALDDLIPKIYQSDWKPADIAQIAPLVVQAAAGGDVVAAKLVEEAAVWLAESVIAVATGLRFEDAAIPVALAGGLVLNSELVLNLLTHRLKVSRYNFGPIELVLEPVKGAVRLALEIAKADLDG
jgi:N-acetylglucosamine kinase-like BadF-type ATPase